MSYSTDNKGLVLIAVLWIVVVMTAIVAVVGQTSRLDMKMAGAAMDDVRCRWACRAGTETALAILNEDPKDSDCLSDLWSDNDEDLNDVRVERCTYSIRVTDEAGKLNINTATRDQLMSLRFMEPPIADAILDWRDRDDNPAAEGAESGYYENLAFPYTIRNGNLKTIRELLAVKGVTEELLYGEDTNLNGLLDYNEMDGDVSPPADNGDSQLDQGWIACLTCCSYENNVDAAGQNRVNINQADEQQLQNALGINAAQARWIARNRGQGFRSIADLINRDSPSQPQGSSGNSSNENEQQPIDLQTFKAIADKISITNERQIPGRVNINTAPEEVLVALLGGEENRASAQAIVAERAGMVYGFSSIAGLLDVQSVGIDRFKRIADLITVRSDVYTIQCFATADVSGASLQTECVVDRSASPPSVLYWYQGANY
ncbi:MAG: general secretion pathway protein GspK [Sedimentisphaerales bacterium]|nr:general secretion pathway protein GspK [Sedimentisphaerales bacterium]